MGLAAIFRFLERPHLEPYMICVKNAGICGRNYQITFLVIVLSLHTFYGFVKRPYVIVLYEKSLSSDGFKLIVALR